MLKKFKNKLTDVQGGPQELNFVLFPPGTHHYLIMRDGSVFRTLSAKIEKDTLSKFQKFNGKFSYRKGADECERAFEWHRFYEQLRVHCASCCIFLLPYELFDRSVRQPRGFIVGDPEDPDNGGLDTMLPDHFDLRMDEWSALIYRVLAYDGVIPDIHGWKDMLNNNFNDGYAFIATVMGRLHPSFLEVPSRVTSSHPKQRADESIEKYKARFKYYRYMEAFLSQRVLDMGEKNTQDQYIQNTRHATKIFEEVHKDRDSPLSHKTDYYLADNFLQTISIMVDDLHVEGADAKTNSLYPSDVMSCETTCASTISDLSSVSLSSLKSFNSDDLCEFVISGLTSEDYSNARTIAVIRNIEKIANDMKEGTPFSQRGTPCAVCGKPGHSFDDCPLLQDAERIKKMYLKLQIASNRFVRAVTNHPDVPPSILQSMNAEQLDLMDTCPALSLSLPSQRSRETARSGKSRRAKGGPQKSRHARAIEKNSDKALLSTMQAMDDVGTALKSINSKLNSLLPGDTAEGDDSQESSDSDSSGLSLNMVSDFWEGGF